MQKSAFKYAAFNLHCLQNDERCRVIEDEEFETCRELHYNFRIGETAADMPDGLDDALNMRDVKVTIEEFLERVGLSMEDVDENTRCECYGFFHSDWEITHQDDQGDTWADLYSDVAISWNVGDWVPTLRTEDGHFDLDSIKGMKPQRDCERLYTSYEEAFAAHGMASACAHMRRFQVTTLAVNDPIHIHIQREYDGQEFSMPTVYVGFTSSGITYREERYPPHIYVDSVSWRDVECITRRNDMGAAH